MIDSPFLTLPSYPLTPHSCLLSLNLSCISYLFSLPFFILFSFLVPISESTDCWQIKAGRQTNDMDGWTDIQEYTVYVWAEIGKTGVSAVCQQFWWVDGRADTALGISGQSAYPSITLSFHPYYPSIPVKLSFSCQGQRGRDGVETEKCVVTGQFSNSGISWTQHFHHNLWLLHVFSPVRSCLLTKTLELLYTQEIRVIFLTRDIIECIFTKDRLMGVLKKFKIQYLNFRS